MDERLSRKITWINSIMMFIVVISHIGMTESNDYAFIPQTPFEEVVNWIWNVMNTLGPCAVSVYFAISGYLFFRNKIGGGTEQKVPASAYAKLVKRTKTVLLPFLIWSCVYWGIFKVVELIPYISNRINAPVSGFPVFLFDFSANAPLWFLLRLFELQLLSVVVSWLFAHMNKWVNLSWILLSLVLDLCLDFRYKGILHWIPVYFLAGWIGYYYFSKIEGFSLKLGDLKIHTKLLVIGLIIGLMCIAGVSQKYMQIAPLVAFLIVGLLPNVQIRKWMKYTFFVYCNHAFFIRVIRKLLFMVLGPSFAGMFTSYVIQIFLIPAILIVMAMLFNKYFPKIYKICMGAR